VGFIYWVIIISVEEISSWKEMTKLPVKKACRRSKKIIRK